MSGILNYQLGGSSSSTAASSFCDIRFRSTHSYSVQEDEHDDSRVYTTSREAGSSMGRKTRKMMRKGTSREKDETRRDEARRRQGQQGSRDGKRRRPAETLFATSSAALLHSCGVSLVAGRQVAAPNDSIENRSEWVGGEAQDTRDETNTSPVFAGHKGRKADDSHGRRSTTEHTEHRTASEVRRSRTTVTVDELGDLQLLDESRADGDALMQVVDESAQQDVTGDAFFTDVADEQETREFAWDGGLALKNRRDPGRASSTWRWVNATAESFMQMGPHTSRHKSSSSPPSVCDKTPCGLDLEGERDDFSADEAARIKDMLEGKSISELYRAAEKHAQQFPSCYFPPVRNPSFSGRYEDKPLLIEKYIPDSSASGGNDRTTSSPAGTAVQDQDANTQELALSSSDYWSKWVKPWMFLSPHCKQLYTEEFYTKHQRTLAQAYLISRYLSFAGYVTAFTATRPVGIFLQVLNLVIRDIILRRHGENDVRHRQPRGFWTDKLTEAKSFVMGHLGDLWSRLTGPPALVPEDLAAEDELNGEMDVILRLFPAGGHDDVMKVAFAVKHERTATLAKCKKASSTNALTRQVRACLDRAMVSFEAKLELVSASATLRDCGMDESALSFLSGKGASARMGRQRNSRDTLKGIVRDTLREMRRRAAVAQTVSAQLQTNTDDVVDSIMKVFDAKAYKGAELQLVVVGGSGKVVSGTSSGRPIELERIYFSFEFGRPSFDLDQSKTTSEVALKQHFKSYLQMVQRLDLYPTQDWRSFYEDKQFRILPPPVLDVEHRAAAPSSGMHILRLAENAQQAQERLKVLRKWYKKLKEKVTESGIFDVKEEQEPQKDFPALAAGTEGSDVESVEASDESIEKPTSSSSSTSALEVAASGTTSIHPHDATAATDITADSSSNAHDRSGNGVSATQSRDTASADVLSDSATVSDPSHQ